MELTKIDEASETYLGQWKHLVSTTNWEKGRIIFEWRAALAEDGAPSEEFSDEAWSRRVGNVSPQHVGRLRRAYERFGQAHPSYPGLYWSHFQAGLDWDDAEMWLEGAVQNRWSISEMRRQRWEAYGAPAELRPRDEDVVAGEWDEDGEAAEHEGSESADDPNVLRESLGVVHAAYDGAELEPVTEESVYDESTGDEAFASNGSSHADETPASPFADLPPLPDDVQEAFDAFKLCILRHKLAGFADISREDLLASLDGLRRLVLAPA